MPFHTDKNYTDRQSKAAYVFDKYKVILSGNVLDVGADNCYLRELLGSGVGYTGIGIGGNPDIEVNLESQTIPFEDNHFDCVLCLDVLEHLDNIHKTFDELCRVSKKYVIISLPNSYRDFVGALTGPEAAKAVNFKYYGLPAQRPDDRHKWFFSNSDADAFIRAKAAQNNMKIVQIDSEGAGKAKTVPSAIKRALLTLAAVPLSVKATDLYYKTHWTILEKQMS
ncbi:MAG: hypothetical protein CO093_05760 [Alphaproteobacteria bacterium CG_4_9_14_3_um_filter_47_13]|nr:MAG: hypothetical protein CO093_05760 [Alphaproteobacteria bacterium CG_4_9_14_3_um_filter_47_13]